MYVHGVSTNFNTIRFVNTDQIVSARWDEPQEVLLVSMSNGEEYRIEDATDLKRMRKSLWAGLFADQLSRG